MSKRAKTSRTPGRRHTGRRIAAWVAGLLLAWGLVTVAEVVVLKWVPVSRTPMMILRAREAHGRGRTYEVKQQWVPLEQINPELVRAVMASEDNLFLSHSGFSKRGIEQAIREKKQRGAVRHGGSTISQQTAKNVFTSGRRSYVRKVREAWFTVLIEQIWGKRRIMEVYLNIVELGERESKGRCVGIFGAEAASQTFFHHPARRLTRSESALLAVCLPNPRKMYPDRPSTYVRKRQGQIVALAPKLGKIDL